MHQKMIDAEEETKDELYNKLQSVVENRKERDDFLD